ncbi:hypothetical protein SNEBB_005528 [Seison nebaliae]|nr:hypothetical protein SNEBB_005528 [Seison nebaliae]
MDFQSNSLFLLWFCVGHLMSENTKIGGTIVLKSGVPHIALDTLIGTATVKPIAKNSDIPTAFGMERQEVPSDDVDLSTDDKGNVEVDIKPQEADDIISEKLYDAVNRISKLVVSTPIVVESLKDHEKLLQTIIVGKEYLQTLMTKYSVNTPIKLMDVKEIIHLTDVLEHYDIMKPTQPISPTDELLDLGKKIRALSGHIHDNHKLQVQRLKYYANGNPPTSSINFQLLVILPSILLISFF